MPIDDISHQLHCNQKNYHHRYYPKYYHSRSLLYQKYRLGLWNSNYSSPNEVLQHLKLILVNQITNEGSDIRQIVSSSKNEQIPICQCSLLENEHYFLLCIQNSDFKRPSQHMYISRLFCNFKQRFLISRVYKVF